MPACAQLAFQLVPFILGHAPLDPVVLSNVASYNSRITRESGFALRILLTLVHNAFLSSPCRAITLVVSSSPDTPEGIILGIQAARL